MDLYGRFLAAAMFPAYETLVRRRPTMANLRFLDDSQWYSLERLRELQGEKLSRLIAHTFHSVPYYRRRMDALGAAPGDITSPDQLRAMPLLPREEARETVAERTSTTAPAAVHKTTSGTMGRPLVFAYNIESEHWRTAVKMRGYSWAGYRVGVRSLHYWAIGTVPGSAPKRLKVALDRGLKRELFIDCSPRGDDHLRQVVAAIARRKPEVIVTFSQAGADLARYILRTGQRTWGTIPVICGAERVFDADRTALESAFGPAVFETYGCREFMLIASECEQHDGLHTSMENLIVEVVVREGDRVRPAQPGELGEVAITDLHNFHQPLIRYLNGDLAVARGPDRCACGRWLERIGPIEGRVTETLRDGDGNRVSGLVFNVLFCDLAEATRQFQVVQHADSSVTLKVVPTAHMARATLEQLRRHCEKYLPGISVKTELVDEIAVTKAGKRKVVVVEDPA